MVGINASTANMSESDQIYHLQDKLNEIDGLVLKQKRCWIDCHLILNPQPSFPLVPWSLGSRPGWDPDEWSDL